MLLGKQNSSENLHKEKADEFWSCRTSKPQQQHYLNTHFSLPLRGPTALTVFWVRCRSRISSSCSISSLSHWRQPKAEQMYLTWKDRCKISKENKLQEIDPAKTPPPAPPRPSPQFQAAAPPQAPPQPRLSPVPRSAAAGVSRCARLLETVAFNHWWRRFDSIQRYLPT